MLRSLVPLSCVVVLLISCGGKKSSHSPAPVESFRVESLDLTSLQVDARQVRDGELSNSVVVQVNFPIHIAFGVTQTGGVANSQFSFGLMQQLTDEEAEALGDDQKHCFLGSTVIHHPGDGNEMNYEASFIVPPECVVNNESAVFNLYVGLDIPGQVQQTAAEEDGNVIIFNNHLLTESRNQKCKRFDGTVGCILEVTVNPSPGVNLTFVSMETESSVAILEPLDEHTGGTDESGNPINEVHSPFAKVISTVLLLGVHTDDETAIAEKNTQIKYDICAEGLFHETCTGAGWMPLTISSVEKSDARSGHDSYIEIDTLRTGEPKYFTNFIYVEGDTHAIMDSGAWSNEEKFIVRGCISSDIQEKIVGSDDGSLALKDNCQTQLVVVIRAATARLKAYGTLNPMTSSVDTYTLGEEFFKRAGSDKTVRVDSKFATSNVMNLDGATSRNSFFVQLFGKIATRPSETYADAAAYVAVAGSYVDLRHKMFNVTLFSYKKDVPDDFTYQKDYFIVKEKCAEFIHSLLVITIRGSMCLGGKAGFVGVFNVKAVDGGQAPFDAATKTGVVTVTFKPESSIYANTSVTAGNDVARGGISGKVRVIEISFPVVGSLQWGLTSLNPVALGISGKVTSDLSIKILDGDIVAYADLREVDICTKSWKIFGKRRRIHYPCGFKWDRKVNENLVSFTGDSRNYKILSRSQTMTLQ